MISTPTANSFAHVAHVGAKKMLPLAGLEADNEGTWTLVAAENPDDGVATLLEQHNVANEYLKASPVIKVEDNSHIRELCILPIAPVSLIRTSKTSENSKETLAEGSCMISSYGLVVVDITTCLFMLLISPFIIKRLNLCASMIRIE